MQSLPGGLYPQCASIAFSDGSEAPGALTPTEAEAVRNAVITRQNEFALGRTCARRALLSHGLTNVELPVGGNRAPVWPSGIVGSITHCRGFIGAIVAANSCLSAVGLDAELAEPLNADLQHMICTADEAAWMQRVPAPLPGWPKILFSAKEAVHKCVSPLYDRMLDFLDVTMWPGQDPGSLRARASEPGRAEGVDLAALEIRVAVAERFVLSCAFVPATPGAGMRLN